MTDENQGAEERLAGLISSVDVRAPDHLRERLQAMTDEASRRQSGRARNPMALRLGASVVALAVLAVALILVLGSSGTSGLSVQRTARFALARATMAAPAESPVARAQLEADVEGVPFPYWGEHFGWEASGSRLDHYAGRTIRTVFYENPSGQTVGYSIVAGGPAPSADAASVQWVHGTPYYLSHLDGAGVVSWVRDGHLCVVSGRGVPADTLMELARWHDRARAV